jgi:hypothetical protein
MSNYSADPGVPQTPAKAYAATILTVLVGFATFYIADEDPFTKKEALQAAISALVAGGLVGGGTYVTRNKAV